MSQEKIFETIAVYYVNKYWNNLFFIAKEEKGNIKENYRLTIERYAKSYKNEKTYNKNFQDMHKYFNKYFNEYASYLDFLNMLIKNLTPQDYKNNQEKNETLIQNMFYTILNKFNNKLTKYYDIITNNELRIDKKYLIELKKIFMDILYTEKTEFHSLVIRKKHGNTDFIPREIYINMQNTIKKLIYDYQSLIKKYNKQTKYIETLKKIISNYSKSSKSSKSDSDLEKSDLEKSESESEVEKTAVINPDINRLENYRRRKYLSKLLNNNVRIKLKKLKKDKMLRNQNKEKSEQPEKEPEPKQDLKPIEFPEFEL